MSDVTVTVKQHGPYLLPGDVTILDHEGKPIPVPAGKKTIALCRCGGSTTKPFCDGTHSRIGFRGAEEAVRDAEE
ncbi:MAG: CDGSH iron-sulfur domain-containing protein [Gemmatimonadaceae bacterium]